jgi:hypothetical protein
MMMGNPGGVSINGDGARSAATRTMLDGAEPV